MSAVEEGKREKKKEQRFKQWQIPCIPIHCEVTLIAQSDHSKELVVPATNGSKFSVAGEWDYMLSVMGKSQLVLSVGLHLHAVNRVSEEHVLPTGWPCGMCKL